MLIMGKKSSETPNDILRKSKFSALWLLCVKISKAEANMWLYMQKFLQKEHIECMHSISTVLPLLKSQISFFCPFYGQNVCKKKVRIHFGFSSIYICNKSTQKLFVCKLFLYFANIEYHHADFILLFYQ